MELQDGVLHIESSPAVTLGIVILFVGKRLNDAIGFLREFSIPEPVTGGLLFSVLFGLLYAVSDATVEFELVAVDCVENLAFSLPPFGTPAVTVRSCELTYFGHERAQYR